MRERRYGIGMHDREVVAAIVAGDPAGLAEAYDRYATPLYSFCRSMLREPADAADAVQDTFVIAAPRMSGLRDPERLRSWLYAVARNECHRRLRAGSQHASIEEAPDVTDEAADVAADVERADLRALVRDALGGVGPTERDVLELQLRQGLSGGEVASVLGIAPIAALPLLAGGLPAGFRDQVLRLATGNSPAAVAHRAAVAKSSYSFGHHGFPRPLHQPGPSWLHPRPAHAGAVAGTAAAVAAGVTWISVPPHHGVPPAGPATPGVTGRADPALGHDGQPGMPGASATARPSALPAAIGSSGAGRPDAAVMAVSPSAGASGAGVGVSPSPGPSVGVSASDAPGAGTLSVSPPTLDLVPPASGSITLTASGGAVNWSVSEPPGLEKKVVVAPMSGTLAAGQTAAISVTVPGPGKPRVHLRFSPGGAIVTVLIS